MANEHLLGVQSGDKTTPINISLEGYTPQTRTASALIPDGNWKAVVKDCALVDKRGKPGKNVRMVLEITAPEEFRGNIIVSNPPAPAGDDDDAGVQMGIRRMKDMLASACDALGAYEQAANQTHQPPAGWFEGKTVHFRSKTEEYRGRERSDVAFFMMVKDYMDSPGPDVMSQAPAVIPATPATPAGSPPDLFTGADQPAVIPAAAPAAAPASKAAGILGL